MIPKSDPQDGVWPAPVLQPHPRSDMALDGQPLFPSCSPLHSQPAALWLGRMVAAPALGARAEVLVGTPSFQGCTLETVKWQGSVTDRM